MPSSWCIRITRTFGMASESLVPELDPRITELHAKPEWGHGTVFQLFSISHRPCMRGFGRAKFTGEPDARSPRRYLPKTSHRRW